ncbi:MAG: hypothetical protein OEU95_00050 [Nitrospirota bacterium]|nr:hypothetical protein [Nitrospirota bacterium]
MFAEVSLIQKCVLLLENPSYAVAVVLAAVLISSGLGSISSARFRLPGSPFILLLLPALMIVYSLLFPLLPDMLAPLGVKTRMAITAAALMPAGFLMGIPFPKGMKLLGERSAAMIPWAWAINASISVLAPAAAVMIALAAGFSTVLWLGALAYLTAFLCLRKLG